MAGTLLGVALVAGSISPAEARPRHGHGGWGGDRWHHRHGDGFGMGDAIGVAALVGAVAIVASSLAKDKKAAQAPGRDEDGPYHDGADGAYDAPPPADGTDYGADRGADRDANRRDDDFSDIAGGNGDDMRIADACAVAARDEAQARGGYAEIRHMEAPRVSGDGYDIDGEVETRASWSASGGTTRRFTCSMRNGRVAEVYLSRDVVAAR